MLLDIVIRKRIDAVYAERVNALLEQLFRVAVPMVDGRRGCKATAQTYWFRLYEIQLERPLTTQEIMQLRDVKSQGAIVDFFFGV